MQLQAFVREFASGIPSALWSRNPFRMSFRNFLRGIHPEIPPGISSKSFYDLQKFLHGFTTGIPSGIFSRNSSRDFFKNSGDLLQKFYQEFHPGIYSKNSSEDFFRGLSIAISPGISTRNSFRKFSDDYLQKFLWIFSENVSGEFLQEFLWPFAPRICAEISKIPPNISP